MPDRTPATTVEAAIGYRDEFTADELIGRQVDSVTGLVFETEEAYLNHVSPVSGHTPKDIEHLEKTTTPDARAISEASQKRGEERQATPQE